MKKSIQAFNKCISDDLLLSFWVRVCHPDLILETPSCHSLTFCGENTLNVKMNVNFSSSPVQREVQDVTGSYKLLPQLPSNRKMKTRNFQNCLFYMSCLYLNTQTRNRTGYQELCSCCFTTTVTKASPGLNYSITASNQYIICKSEQGCHNTRKVAVETYCKIP